jgi:hypothetical protein
VNATVEQALRSGDRSAPGAGADWTLAEPTSTCMLIARLSWLLDLFAIGAAVVAAACFAIGYAGWSAREDLVMAVALRCIGLAAAALVSGRLLELANYFTRRTDPRGEFARRRSDREGTEPSPGDDAVL